LEIEFDFCCKVKMREDSSIKTGTKDSEQFLEYGNIAFSCAHREG
jgi:hypothetical protein